MDLRALIARLDPLCREALESAAGLTLSRTHYNVEIEHWLLKLLEQRSDVTILLEHFEIDAGRLASDLNRTLDRMATGNGRAPALSPHLVKLAREAWLLASLEHHTEVVRSGHLLAALLQDGDLSHTWRETTPQLARIPADVLSERLVSLTAASPEASAAAAPSQDAEGQPMATPPAPGGAALDKFCIDLTARARAGGIDPVLGRDPEIRQIIDVLTRRRQNNPILTGEAGVGKTAVVEGFALKILAGEVPEALLNVRLLSLDLGLLQAGAGVKGEFENRLKSVIDEVKRSPTPIVMFIDEAHTLIGAGGQEGQGDAANLLKPALARGEMRTIAATTWAEYKKYFEKDPALTRRFQVVKVEEPSEADAIQMMRGLVETLETHHKVRILDEAVDACVRLSHRFIAGRQLPDKSISLLDTACARVAMSQAATPGLVEAAQRRIEQLETELRILGREQAAGAAHDDAIAARTTDLAAAQQKLEVLNVRLKTERELVSEMAAMRVSVEAAHAASDAAALGVAREGLGAARAKLEALQGEAPLVFEVVDRQAVADVVATWTGIPVGRMVSDEIRNVLNIEAIMGARIRGQPQALAAIAKTMQSARAGLTDPRKPLGVFLMCGTSGVGKTETAMTLAEQVYGGPQNMTVINMSEFKEEHKVSMLVGSPPGYVGYGEGGVLTEAVRRKPFSVVLLDEMEKAHPGVQDIFYQVFDKGQLKDGQGRDIDFKNTLIVMTSNAGTDVIEKLCGDPETMPDAAGLGEALRPELLKVFKPAFLGRVTVVPYFPLPPEILREIVVINLARLRDRIAANYGVALSWADELPDVIAARCTETQSGARNVESILNQNIVPALANQILQRMSTGEHLPDIRIQVSKDQSFEYQFGDCTSEVIAPVTSSDESIQPNTIGA
ncbi:type VI secretion system ATPase TssH [Phenylobacterium sp.]|uniref:type VI secretion system ATPase TssH n=1 Tax=Phenylobacterium sp. TaxID=1871053 RepID=UPI00286B68B9|nr:type VI secretion system ATPase TssH [Phenylobacterium sp.]